ncbi:hypothetical protein [Streptomyces tsukubensis]|uniref:Secreted protein n=1 Tax=Streptomyces tsukubensis TaxID=83656 RepID=A0A1V4A9I2_9ACTN|nr:hypothetical protein [Streptomyces tsukubensis]OON79170.1 hypothetical protein B1H18_14435 [Streptomyces tsukubensis]QFR94719.1 hypothetical protein GBW32_18775 [Streptomyces tsukubensis]
MRATPKRLLSRLLPYLAAVLAAGVLTAPGAHAADIPTRDQVRAAIGAGAPSTSFFWSGRDQWEQSVAPRTEKIAVTRGQNGATLAMRLAAGGLRPPEAELHTPETVEFWNFASKEFAAQASGKVWFVRGTSLRPDNTWEAVEFPALKANPKVTCVFRIDVNVASEEHLLHGDPARCADERVVDQAKATCGIWRDAGWPHPAPPARVTTTTASTGRDAVDERRLVGGRATPPWAPATRAYSVEPAPTGTDRTHWLDEHARLDVRFTHPTGTTVAHTRLRDHQGRVLDDDFTCPATSTRSDL